MVVTTVQEEQELLLLGEPPWPTPCGARELRKVREIEVLPSQDLGPEEISPIALEEWRACFGEATLAVEVTSLGPRRWLVANGDYREPELHLLLQDETDHDAAIALDHSHPETERLVSRVKTLCSGARDLLSSFGELSGGLEPGGTLRQNEPEWRRWRKRGGGLYSSVVLQSVDDGLAIELGVAVAPTSKAASQAMFLHAVLNALSLHPSPGSKSALKEVAKAVAQTPPWNEWSSVKVDRESLLAEAWDSGFFHLVYELSEQEDGL
jgi:hypothetical protein